MRIKVLALLVILAVFLAPTYTPLSAQPTSPNRETPTWKAYIDPGFLSQDPDLPVRAILVVGKDFNYSLLLPYTRVARGTPPIGNLKLIRTVIKPKDVAKISELEGVVGVFLDKRLHYEVPLDPELKTSVVEKGEVEPQMYQIVDLVRASDVWTEYGYTGKGVTVAIVDTGVDFGHPDLYPAMARNATGYPLYFDPDEMGLVLTNNTYVDDGDLILTVGVEGPRNISYYIPWMGAVGKFDLLTITPGTIDLTYLNTIGYTSQSGEYHVGVAEWQGGYYYGYYLVIFVDNGTAGRYEAVFVDLDQDAVIEDFEGPFDWGHRAAVIGDFNHDGILNMSLGVVGGYTLDWWGIFDTTGQILEWDYEGRWVLLQYDYYGHGTQCASTAAGRGGYTGLMGIAPGAKLIGVTALYLGDIIEAWLWAAGFDLETYNDIEVVPMYGTVVYGEWTYTGEHKADIISNSWGWSSWVEGSYYEWWFWYDVLTILEDALMIPYLLDPEYTGTLMVQAAGNGGPGFGTVTETGYSILALTVGASTSYHYTWTYGYSGYNDTIIFWSARGPTPLGFSKPDIVAVGAYGFTAIPLYSGAIWWGLFGGTSMATPMTAGAAAIVYEAFRDLWYEPFPETIKCILMSTATDLMEDPYSQGAGRIDIYRAVKLVAGEGGVFIVTGDSWNNALEAIEDAWMSAFLHLNTSLGLPFSTTPDGWYGNAVTESFYGGFIRTGTIKRGQVYLFNPSGVRRTYKLMPFTYCLVKSTSFTMTITPNMYYTYHPIPVRITPGRRVVITMIGSLEDYYEGNYSQFNVFDWVDDGDGVIETDEVYRIADSYNEGNVQYLTFNSSLIRGVPVFRIISMGIQGNFTVTVKVEEWDTYIPHWVRVTPGWVSLGPGESAFVTVTIMAKPGMIGPYEAYIKVVDTTTGYKSLIPVSFVAVPYIRNTWIKYKITSSSSQKLQPYDALRVRGVYDQGWRYETGDWRVLFFNVKDEDDKLVAIKATVSWKYPNTDINVHGVGGHGIVWDQGVTNYQSDGNFTWGTRTGTTEEYVWIWDGGYYGLWPYLYPGFYRSVTGENRALILHNVLIDGSVPADFPESYEVTLDFYKVYFSGGYDVKHASRFVEVNATAGETVVVWLTFESSEIIDVTLNVAWYDDMPPTNLPLSFTVVGKTTVPIEITVPADTPTGTYTADVEVQLGNMPYTFYCWITVNVQGIGE